ncbi:hypothetical protein ACVILL_003982 [Bradyrhizobium sp. USDA 3364]
MSLRFVTTGTGTTVYDGLLSRPGRLSGLS